MNKKIKLHKPKKRNPRTTNGSLNPLPLYSSPRIAVTAFKNGKQSRMWYSAGGIPNEFDIMSDVNVAEMKLPAAM